MDWSTFKPASCVPNCWCEAPRFGSFILEPVNSWSNLSFILIGFYILLKPKKIFLKHNPLNTVTFFTTIYAGALIFLGLGSFFFHASQTFLGQWFDVFGMYLVTNFFILYNFVRFQKINSKIFLSLYLSSSFILGVIIYYVPELRRWLFGASLVLILSQILIIYKIKPSRFNSKYLFASVGCYLLGQFFWLLDKYKYWCWPYSMLNGHGLWHVLTSLSALFIFDYFKSEEII